MVSFENLQIKRLIAHEVVTAKALLHDGPGIISEELTALEVAGRKLVSRRLSEALGANSHSVEVEVEKDGPESVFAHTVGLLEANDAAFIRTSQQLAKQLSAAQVVGSIKGGIVVVLEATIGPDEKPQRTMILVKAESDPAFIKQAAARGVLLQYVHEMVFGPQQRLFKIGAFVETARPNGDHDAGHRSPRDFTAIVYDHGMDIKDAGVPAKYFYAKFLGTTTAPSAPALNKRFFEATSEFINASSRTRSEKWELRTALITYFRSQETLISGRHFGERYLRDDAERVIYRRFLYEAGVPSRAIEKDTKFIKENLRLRRLVFSSRVSLIAPAERFNELVAVVDANDDSMTVRIAGKIIDDD